MTRTLQRTTAVATVFAILISTVTAQTSTAAVAGPITTGDCYSSIPSDFEDKGQWTFQTSGYCQSQCVGFSVMATSGGSTCYCGNELPSDSNKASSGSCNTPCQGYSTDNCGGTNFYQLYLTGDGSPGANAGAGSSSSLTTGKPQTSTSAVPSVVTQSGKVVTVTASASTSTSDSSGSSGGGGSKVGIAVGVVVGIIAVASIIGILVVFFKRRRRLAIEEEHRRTAAVSSFVGSGKSETSSTTDQRLDPAFSLHRRNSLGSIADERDFSRRILQVRNPDRESKASNMA